jgi:flagellar FliL protein
MAKETRIDLIKVGAEEKKRSSASIREGDVVSSPDPKLEGSKIKRIKKTLIFGMAGLVFLCGSVGAAWKLGWMTLSGPSHGKKPGSPISEGSEIGPTVKLAPLTLNLKEASGRNYLKVTIVLEIGKKDWFEEIQSRMPTLTDMVIVTLCDKGLEDLRHPEAKEQLKQELLAKMNQHLGSNKIKRIYFDEFLFQ